MRLSVIIVNYNVGYFLEQCLYTVLAATKGLATEIIVVDNASTDNSRALLADRFPAVQFIWNEVNAGFGKANNQALAKAKGEYIVLLNPDTLVPQDIFSTCIRFLEAHPDAGAVGMRMYDGQGRFLPESKRSWPGIMTSFYKLSGLISIFPKQATIARYYMGHLSPEQVHPVEVLAGAFMVLPRKVYEQVGGFDERFFMYGEDIDLSYRISLAGFTNYYLPAPGLIHFKGESTQANDTNTGHFYEAMELFVQKYYPQQSRQWRFFLRTAIKVRGLMSRISRGKKRVSASGAAVQWTIKGDLASKAEIKEKNPGKSIVEQGGEGCIYALGDDYGLREVIDSWTPQGPPKKMRYHGQGTRAIIGSDDKNGLGEVMIMPVE